MKLLTAIRLAVLSVFSILSVTVQAEDRPNILFAIADDQSFLHAGAYGFVNVKTPAFDRVASEGILFGNAFVAAPQCSPSRAAILTGKNIWQLEEAGTHASSFPKKFTTFTDQLEAAGYHIGYTGKAWGPGNYRVSGRKRNPVGPGYSRKKVKNLPNNSISPIDYAGNFADFLAKRKDRQPFFFWYGCLEPHRPYKKGSGVESGKSLAKALIPAFLPDSEATRGDLLDYALEIEYFDAHLLNMLRQLERAGELENTIVVVTADNGMPFPYAKANLQEFGTHVPLAIAWPAKIKPSAKCAELVSLIDLAPTFLELAGVKDAPEMTGKSLTPVLLNNGAADRKPHRDYVLTGRERHTHARPDNLGYPARAIRSKDFLYIKNYTPDRWPLGDPVPVTPENDRRNRTPGFAGMYPGYLDIDPSPSKSYMLTNAGKYPELFKIAFGMRPAEQLYDIKSDPHCLKDIAREPQYADVKARLREQLDSRLTRQGDPRMSGSEVFDSYPRYSTTRMFEGFHSRGKYNPKYQEGK
ncbi:MAG: sulfatase [Akkermansiaceae bacterium]|nr:sulfatase [Akkermansiaceae bacterium]